MNVGMPTQQYLDKCIESVQGISEKSLISGLGELTVGEMKNFLRHGPSVEVLTPEWFRDEVAEDVRNMMKRYD